MPWRTPERNQSTRKLLMLKVLILSPRIIHKEAKMVLFYKGRLLKQNFMFNKIKIISESPANINTHR